MTTITRYAITNTERVSDHEIHADVLVHGQAFRIAVRLEPGDPCPGRGGGIRIIEGDPAALEDWRRDNLDMDPWDDLRWKLAGPSDASCANGSR